MPNREILNSYTLLELKNEIKKTNIKGFTTLTKTKLIEVMLQPEHKNKFHHMKGKVKKQKSPKPTPTPDPTPDPNSDYEKKKRERLEQIKKDDEARKLAKKKAREDKKKRDLINKEDEKKLKKLTKDIRLFINNNKDKLQKLKIGVSNWYTYSLSKLDSVGFLRTGLRNANKLHVRIKEKLENKPPPAPPNPPKPPDPPKTPDKLPKTAEMTIDDALNIYNKKKLENPVPFKCIPIIDELYFISIMKNNKNDCIMPKKRGAGRFMYTESGVVYFGAETRLRGSETRELISSKKNTKIMSEIFESIAKMYLHCKKNNKALVMPVSRPRHANMSIFNYKRKEFELFEPHGAGLGGVINEKVNASFKRITEKINVYLPDDEKLTYIPPHEICPVGFKSFQSHESQNKHLGVRFNILGVKPVYINKDSGYCCAWSFFYLDLRLKGLSLSGREIYNITIAKVKKDPNDLKRFIRGLTNDLYLQLLVFFKKMKIPDNEAAIWIAMDVNYDEIYFKVNDKLREYLDNNYMKELRS